MNRDLNRGSAIRGLVSGGPLTFLGGAGLGLLLCLATPAAPASQSAELDAAAARITAASQALAAATAPEGLRPVDYMRLCFAMMEAADVVLFMQDYQDSRGAMLEWAWCQYVGKQTCFDLAAFGGGDNA